MSYYSNYATLIEKQRQEDNEKKKKQLIDKIRAQQERFRRRYEKVFRGPRKNVTKGEANEYMTLMKEYYAKKALREEKKRGDEFKLPKSAHKFQKEKSQKKFGKSKTKKSNKKSPTYKLTATLRKNRKKQKPIDAESKILTNKNNYRMSLRGTKKKLFRRKKMEKKNKKKTQKKNKKEKKSMQQMVKQQIK